MAVRQKAACLLLRQPNLYLQCKEDKKYLVIGIWNFFEDEAIEPVIRLAKEYDRAEFLFGSGTLLGDRAVLSDIPPYGFRGIVLEKSDDFMKNLSNC